jgi:predicted transport protein
MRIQKTWLHTLGNLTLTRYNSEFGARSFAEKRDMKGGFKESPLRLNAELGSLDRWDEDAIKCRAGRLADVALEVWPSPKLSADVLAGYASKAAKAKYSIVDHPHLCVGAMHDLFEGFRKEVLALDPCVSEKFLRLYVAYKAETNFVDVDPQVNKLRLSLNLRFVDINDPRGLCKDVSGRSRRGGNGDVEVGLTSMEDLPYVMGLVRQSFERQMGNGSEA